MTSNKRAHKVVISFATPEGALAWFDAVRAAGFLPGNADLFQADGLDFRGGASPRTYLMRDQADRPEAHALRNNLHGRHRDP